MKITCMVLILSLSQASFAAGNEKCSVENLEKLLHLSSKLIGEMGQSSIETAKMFTRNDVEKLNGKEIRANFFKVLGEQNKKLMPIIDETEAFVKAHPECDKNHYFSLKVE